MARMGLCLFLLAAVAAMPARALDPDKLYHQYPRDSWSIEEGLPQISAHALTQGPDGYIWVGTQAALARFDGVEFRRFDEENTPALKGGYINALLTDRQGRIWIGTYKGVAVREDGEFRAITAGPESGLEDAQIDVRSFAQRDDGTVLVASEEGLFRIADDRLHAATEIHKGAAYGLLAESDRLWVGGTGELVLARAGSTRRFELPPDHRASLVTRLERYQDRLWVGTNNGLFVLANGSLEPYRGHRHLPDTPIESMYADADGNLWVGTNPGLFRIVDGEVREFIDNEHPAAFKQVESFTEDHEGSLWMGGYRDGIARFWDGWTYRYSTATGLHEPLVWSVAPESDGGIWVGTNAGLSILRDGRFEKLLAGNDLPHPHAYTLLEEEGRLYIGTRAGVAIYEDGALRRPDVFRPMDDAEIRGIVRTDAGLWFATTNGLYRYDEGTLEHYGEAEGLDEIRVRYLHKTQAGEFYVATRSGLYRREGDRFSFIGPDRGLHAVDMSSIHERDDGTLLISTISKGLYVGSGDRWRHYTEDDGLPSNVGYFITEDDAGKIWVGGFKGLYRVPFESFAAYDDGRIEELPAEMILNESGGFRGAQKAHCCNGAGNAKGFIRDNVLVLPTRSGVVKVDPDKVRKNSEPPNVLVERIRYGNQWHEVRPDTRMKLPADQRDVTLEFTALSFQDPESVRLRYKLQGYDNDWQIVDDPTRRTANYTNLPSGDYVMRVRAANNAQVWAEEDATLQFTIAPYYYETWWFYTLVTLAGIGVIGLGYRMRLGHLEAQRRELGRVIEQRTEELRVANEQLKDASQTDLLTNLKNRRYLFNQLPVDLAHFHRVLEQPGHDDVALVYMIADIDHFKEVNDEYGHKAGDEVLAQFADILSDMVRTGDYVVRWGGEEFLVVFRPMPRKETPKLAERIRRLVAEKQFKIAHGEDLSLTCSVGFCEYPFFGGQPRALDWEQSVELADHALYQAKESGRNAWAGFRPTDATDPATVIDDVSDSADAAIEAGRVELVKSW